MKLQKVIVCTLLTHKQKYLIPAGKQLSGKKSSINRQRDPVDHGSFVAEEEENTVGDVLHLSKSAEGNLGQHGTRLKVVRCN